ncbi:type I restriction enzyme HsdR N-terminal domain-containing protein [Pseudoalteromonas sp. SWYJZ19]|uniref:type I restriction enzyme HsdR N-terminal domain-containing protein n=1 Tax=Pseudoalteromonas sp. SWYJZ19 TaxID=2792068 RepID=UPI0018CFD82A|nr:type I restriction enzyme HsdR N-terminal domain-containing protein [Pseudoalteromonas sp. SWYJZ19]MBH0049016.1 hypothetical protein [Pseudoalteromonas sp. SWYJZ19]
MWHQAQVNNESDVEQKIIYPMLNKAYPVGLGVDDMYIKTKANIRRLQIGKGQEGKLYFPDYLVVIDGYPAICIEAKAPKIELDEAYREARLYATEINSSIQSGVNTCQFVLAINDKEIWYGYSDQAEPVNKIKIIDCDSTSESLNELQVFLSIDKVKSHLQKELSKVSASSSYSRAKSLLGGAGIQGEELDRNSFGATVTSAIANIFNPLSYNDRKYVSQNAYVSSRRKQRYIEPIDKLIRAANPTSISDAVQLEDTEKPSEIISKLNDIKSLDRQVMLLIGSVGSGKSTFIDYLFNKALDKSLTEKVAPVRIDMNNSPLSQDEIYSWLRQKVIEGCKNTLKEIDFDDISIIEKVYATEINKAKKGDLSYFDEGSLDWRRGLREEILRLKGDEILTTNAFVRFCCAERGRTLIIVLDNCDKKETKEQLLMFQVAQWIQDSLRCLVILPLRDETYDNYKHLPPLDTALKDLVFRIEPPLLQQVLVSRVKLSLKELEGGANETLSYELPNGFRVEYPKSDRAYYLTAILSSIFEYNNFVRNIIVGLSGRNIRRALEIFIELCNSAHLDSSEILKIRHSEGTHKIAFHKILTILLRINKRYYGSEGSYIKNLFDRKDDTSPINSFSRFLILTWLKSNNQTSRGKFKGYHPIKDVVKALNEIGISEDTLFEEILYLVKGNCIVSEDFKTENLCLSTLIKITPSGEIHLDLASNITYLATISEESLTETPIAEKVKKRIMHLDNQMSYQNSLLNAIDFYESLKKNKDEQLPPFEEYIFGTEKVDLNLSEIEKKVEAAKHRASDDPWFMAEKTYVRGSTHRAIVQNKVDYCCFVNFEDGAMSRIKNEDIEIEIDSFDVGDMVQVEILWVNTSQRKIGAKVLELLEEEKGDF